MILTLSVTGRGWVTFQAARSRLPSACRLLLMIVSLRLGPGPGRDFADFPKASLGVRCDCGPAGEGHVPPYARPFRTADAGSGGSLGICPGAAWQRPGSLLLGRSWPAQRIGPGARSVEAVLLVRVGQRRLTH
jgi:hypothetical protein